MADTVSVEQDRPVYVRGATLRVRRRLFRWSWSVKTVYDITLTGWAFRKSKAYRAAFHAVPGI